jgi:hypothetical protein
LYAAAYVGTRITPTHRVAARDGAPTVPAPARGRRSGPVYLLNQA